MRMGAWRAWAVLIVWAGAVPVAAAQEHVTFHADVLFYGDDTEFRNEFREGETIFGAAAWPAIAFDFAGRARLMLGAFGNLRFGGDDAFETARPVVSLEIAGKHSTFVFGTLSTPKAASVPGPDRTGPHGLLPPIQRETLAFDRPYEAGIAWTFASARERHELWINWQRVNTSDHRERFDAGAIGGVRLSRLLEIPFQLHIVHEGGQLFASGPVADSSALATGITIAGRVGRVDRVALELYAAGSRVVPDRASPDRTRNGAAFFGRASGEHGPWRAHLIVWRGKDFIKDEGDPNYLSVRRDGSRYRGMRDYSETGLTYTFKPVKEIVFEMSGRLHRIERHYEISFRILATAAVAVKLR
jgi:hypothetical protein